MKALLSLPLAYRTFRHVIGGQDLNRTLVSRYVRPKSQERVLDIGCGPASVLEFLPSDVSYVGFDPSPGYIAAAKSQYGNRGAFFAGYVTAESLGTLGQFDTVLSVGVLHHLDDDAARDLCKVACLALRPGGRFVTIDGCYVNGQSPIARFLLNQDRGRHVRSEAEYRALAQSQFSMVTTHVRDDLLRMPYTHLIMECMNP